MPHVVELSRQAESDIHRICHEIRDHGGDVASWIGEIGQALASLESDPAAQPLAPENENTPFVVRQLACGAYRVLFEVRKSQVQVLTIRHADHNA